MSKARPRKRKTSNSALPFFTPEQLKEFIEAIEVTAMAEDRSLTSGERKEIDRVRRLVAKKEAAAADRVKEVVRKKQGAVEFPKKIPHARIRKAGEAGIKRFERELKAEAKRLLRRQARGLSRNDLLELSSGDFIQEIKDHIGKKGRRPGAIGELVSSLGYFDWRLSGTISPVRTQGECNSCWAFAAVAAFESRVMYNAIRFRVFSNEETSSIKSIAFSVQDVLDDIAEGTCQGGSHTHAFELFLRRGGRLLDFNEFGVPIDVAKESIGRTRARVKPETRIKAMAWGFVFENRPLIVPRSDRDIRKMKAALLKYGPLTVGLSIDAHPDRKFQTYRQGKFPRGVYDFDPPKPMGVNHIAVLTGWDDGRKAWILLNSFGPDWGGPCVDIARVKEYLPFTMHNVKNRLAHEGGCMFIRWGVSNVGRMAAWIEAPLLNAEWFEQAESEKTARRESKRRSAARRP